MQKSIQTSTSLQNSDQLVNGQVVPYFTLNNGSGAPLYLINSDGSVAQAFTTMTFGSSLTINPASNANIAITLVGNLSLTLQSGIVDGQRLLLRLTQDATGSRLLTLPANVSTGPIGTVTLSTAASLSDYLGFMYNSSASKWNLTSFIKGY